MKSRHSLIGGVGLGAGLMYVLDPSAIPGSLGGKDAYWWVCDLLFSSAS